jgi:beta-glucanase (GH16 family)
MHLKGLVKLGVLLSGLLLAGQVLGADETQESIASGLSSLSGTNPNPIGSRGQYGALVSSDEFNGYGRPNDANWNYHVGSGFNKDISAMQGWGNGEWQWYRPENCYQANGNLVLRAEYNATPTEIAGANRYQFSCRITTQGKQSWTYGRIEARLAVPNIIGSWPAFWMLGDASDASYTGDYNVATSYYDSVATNWPSMGEIDIFEHVNGENFTYQNIFWDMRDTVYHWAKDQNANAVNTGAVGNVADFHTYAIEWDASSVRWFVDNVQTQVIDITPANMEEFRRPMHLILNFALGGKLTQGLEPQLLDFPAHMYVDYVRVYQ